MSRFGGVSSAEIAAPAAVCFELVCDAPRTPEWHQAIVAVEVLERDGEGRTSLVKARIDAVVAQVELNLRLTYEEQRVLHMRRESGDLKHLTATWRVDELGDGRTRARFQTEFDPGRVLSILAKGPIVGRLESSSRSSARGSQAGDRGQLQLTAPDPANGPPAPRVAPRARLPR